MASTAAVRLNLSFAGCGFLGMYHLGVAKALCRHGNRLIQNVERYCGASAGALVASMLAILGSEPRVIEECVDFCMKLALTTRQQPFGVLSRTSNLLAPLEKFLDQLLPLDAHERATDRLYVSVTCCEKRTNEIVSRFKTRDELIKYLLASSCVIHITSPTYVTINGRKYCDGGLTNNLPSCFPEDDGSRTILVSPFDGKQDICPSDDDPDNRPNPLTRFYMSINEQIFRVSMSNVRRGLHTFVPPPSKELHRYYIRGVRDAVRFLRREGLYDPVNFRSLTTGYGVGYSNVGGSEEIVGGGEREKKKGRRLSA